MAQPPSRSPSSSADHAGAVSVAEASNLCSACGDPATPIYTCYVEPCKGRIVWCRRCLNESHRAAAHKCGGCNATYISDTSDGYVCFREPCEGEVKYCYKCIDHQLTANLHHPSMQDVKENASTCSFCWQYKRTTLKQCRSLPCSGNKRFCELCLRAHKEVVHAFSMSANPPEEDLYWKRAVAKAYERMAGATTVESFPDLKECSDQGCRMWCIPRTCTTLPCQGDCSYCPSCLQIHNKRKHSGEVSDAVVQQARMDAVSEPINTQQQLHRQHPAEHYDNQWPNMPDYNESEMETLPRHVQILHSAVEQLIFGQMDLEQSIGSLLEDITSSLTCACPTPNPRVAANASSSESSDEVKPCSDTEEEEEDYNPYDAYDDFYYPSS